MTSLGRPDSFSSPYGRLTSGLVRQQTECGTTPRRASPSTVAPPRASSSPPATDSRRGISDIEVSQHSSSQPRQEDVSIDNEEVLDYEDNASQSSRRLIAAPSTIPGGEETPVSQHRVSMRQSERLAVRQTLGPDFCTSPVVSPTRCSSLSARFGGLADDTEQPSRTEKASKVLPLSKIVEEAFLNRAIDMAELKKEDRPQALSRPSAINLKLRAGEEGMTLRKFVFPAKPPHRMGLVYETTRFRRAPP